MAALEYLTNNSLTAHPFKSGRAEGDYPLENDWFYDMLFASFSPKVQCVFVSKIKKTGGGELQITFSDKQTLAVIGASITIASTEVVNHYNNPTKSFAYASLDEFAVKLVFGPGLISALPFEYTYTAAEAELSSACIVLCPPRVTSITFESYDTKISQEPYIVARYTTSSDPLIPVVQPRHNSIFVLDALNSGSLHVARLLGAGLYNDCSRVGNITDVYSINTVLPNSKGALFLNPSQCYTANVLTESYKTDLDSQLYLDPYYLFTIHTGPATTDIVDIVDVEHSIVFKNFCNPKCPPENMGAFAHYLNRVTNGVDELAKIAYSHVETRGSGDQYGVNPNVFRASAFCLPDDVFARCTTHDTPETAISCGGEFIKYFHEGRTLDLYYSNVLTRRYKILEVLDSATVRLASPITGTGSPIPFRVIDNGVYSNMNCAISSYNLTAEAFQDVYFKVKYTTTESFNSNGSYVTYLAVVAALFNPSRSAATASVTFTPSENLHQQGAFKIRTAASIDISTSSVVSLGCRQYALVEAVFYIGCGEVGGSLAVDVYEHIEQISLKIGDTFTLPNIRGADCIGALSGAGAVHRVRQSEGLDYSEVLSIDSNITEVVTYGELPLWLTITPNYTTSTLLLHTSQIPSDLVSRLYTVYFRSYGGPVSGVISKLVIDYVANPVIVSPLGSKYSAEEPLPISTTSAYTSDNPVFQIASTNNWPLSNNFSTDYAEYTYSCSPVPTGMVFNTSTGMLTGTLSTTYASAFTLSIDAHNPSGGSSNPQVLHCISVSKTSPTVSFSASTPGPVITLNNLQEYTRLTPLVAFTASNSPIYFFKLTGTLFPGLSFDPSKGVIFGRVRDITETQTLLSITATNRYGEADALAFTLDMPVVYSAPSIISPIADYVYSLNVADESTESSPLFTIFAHQADGDTDIYTDCLTNTLRNKYTARGLPPGFTLDICTGKLYGKLDSAEYDTSSNFSRTYTVRLIATNPLGERAIYIKLTITGVGVPVFTNTSAATIIYPQRYVTYTTERPLYTFYASNSPTSFSVSGLPADLSCTSAGLIVGKLNTSLPAGKYNLHVSASNTTGTSVEVVCALHIPIDLYLADTLETAIPLVINYTYTNFLTVASSGVLGDNVVRYSAGLPSGLSFSGNTIVGTVSSETRATVPVRIYANSYPEYYGIAYYDITIQVDLASFNISGAVHNSAGLALEGVTITTDSGQSTITNTQGLYTLPFITTGSKYSVSASKKYYQFLPESVLVDINGANATDINFTATGPFRFVTGRVVGTNQQPLSNIVVFSGSGYNYTEGRTDATGTYSMHVPLSTALGLTPITKDYKYTPDTINIPAGTADVTDADFVASVSIVPTAPTIINILPGDKSLVVEFTPPTSAGSSEIIDYVYSTDGWSTFAFANLTQLSSPITIGAGYLVNGVTYVVAIAALSLDGVGDRSELCYGTPYTIPSAPVIDSISENNTEISIYFTKPTSNGGSPITNYQFSTDGGSTWADNSPISVASPIRVTGLLNDFSYSVKIRGVNAAGNGEASSAIPATPSAYIQSAVATAPVITSIVSLLPGTLSVYFNPPTSNGGSAIINYYYSIDNWDRYSIPDPPVTESPLLITDVPNGERLAIVIAAKNGVGVYPSLAWAAIAAGPPDPPTALIAYRGNNKLTIVFNPGSNRGSPILDYEYSVQGGAYVSAGTAAPPVVVPEVIVDGVSVPLTNGVIYKVTLTARNALGYSAVTDPVYGTPELTMFQATAPQNVAVIEGDGTLTATFEAPSSNGYSTITSYQYSLDNANTWLPSTPTAIPTQSPIELTGLSSSEIYYVSVRALNELGGGVPSVPVAAMAATAPNLTQFQIINLTTTRLVAFTTTQIPLFTTVQIPAFTTTQIPAFTTTQIPAFTTTQIPAFTTTQVAAFTTTQFPAFETQAVEHFTTTQIAAIQTVDLRILTTSQVQALTSTQIAALTTLQAAALTTVQIVALTSRQIPAIETQDVQALTTAQIAVFTTLQLPTLTASQIVAMSSAQLAASNLIAIANTWGLTEEGQYGASGRYYHNGVYVGGLAEYNAAIAGGG